MHVINWFNMLYANVIYISICKQQIRENFKIKGQRTNMGYKLEWKFKCCIDKRTNVKDIIYNNGKIIAVGKLVLVSEDKGITWNEYYIESWTDKTPYRNSNTNFKVIAYDKEHKVYLMVGDNWYVLYSTDAIEWKYVSPDPKNNKFSAPTPYEIRKFKDAISANGKFYACGGTMGNLGIAVFTFKNCKVELEQETMMGKINGSGELQSIAYHGKYDFIAVANGVYGVYSIENGITWKQIEQPKKLQAYPVSYFNGAFYSLDLFRNNTIFKTTNPSTGWSIAGDANSGRQINETIVVGNAIYGAGMYGTILMTEDGTNWNKLNAKTDYQTHFSNLVAVP